MFCRNCGNQIPDNAKFCDNCGMKVERIPDTGKTAGSVPGKAPLEYGIDSYNPCLTGFSQAYLSPQIIEFKNKKKKSSGGCLMSLAIIIPVGVLIIGLIGLFTGDNDIENALFLTGLSLIPAAVLFIISLLIKARARREKPMWEGVITDKKKEEVRDYHKEKHNEDQGRQYYTLYTFYVRTDSGEKKKFCKSDNPALYGYYNVGDRVRFHPVLDYCEKYDKSHDKYIFCACCECRNPISNNVCKNCGMPLFK